MSRRQGVGTQRRNGFRGIGQGVLLAPAAPSITGTMSRGQVISITPGAGGGPVSSYTLFRDGIAVPTQTTKSKATLEARALVDVDLGPSITVRANGPGGSSASSNELAYTPAAVTGNILDLAGDSLPASGVIASWTDRSAQLQPAVQSTGGLQPTVSAINGRKAARFTRASAQRLRIAAMTGLGSASPQLTVAIAVKFVGTSPNHLIWCFEAAAAFNQYIIATFGWSSAFLGGVEARWDVTLTTDGLYLFVLRRSNVSTNTVRQEINGTQRAINTGALTALGSATPLFVIGATDAGALPSDMLMRSIAVWPRALSDAEVLDQAAYMANEVSPSPSWTLAPRVMFVSDSTGVGVQGMTGGYRPRVTAAMTSLGLTPTLVGPFSDGYGDHRSVGSETGRSVVLGASDVGTGLIAYLQAHTPDVVVLGHAINDMVAGSFDASATVTMRRDLTAICREVLPLTKVVHTSVIKWTGYAPGIPYLAEADTFNATMPAAAADMGCAYLDLGAPTLSDGVHPTDAAYLSLADNVIAPGLVAVCGG